MKFIGIDLGWKSGASGLCCLGWINGQLEILDLNHQKVIVDIFTWLDNWVLPEEPAIIAVDAPTLIPNATGTRLPDKLTHKHFGKYHAGCYPANLSLPFAERTVSFGLQLEARGFVHAPIMQPQQLGRYQIEVYPHPAIVHLFNLKQILKYKKGRLLERQLELQKLRNLIIENLPTRQPSINLSSLSEYLNNLFFAEIPRTGVALKAVEDQLDSLICAYVGAHWWYWGKERNLVLGDQATGYIVVPNSAKDMRIEF